MKVFNSLAELTELVPPPAPEAKEPTSGRSYDCTGCRFVDSHGLVCGFCLRKILDSQADRRSRHDRRERTSSSLIAACFDGHTMTLLQGKRAALV